MNAASRRTRNAGIARWVARAWSLLIVAFVVMMVVTPDPYATEPVPAEDWFLLGVWGVAVLGLVVAWRWERTGALITIGTMFLREPIWVILKGGWLVNFLIVWVALVPPAVLFLLSWRWRRGQGE
jgi:hypothetical protein